MSWAEEDWTVGLSGRVLQKVKELQVHQERLSRENKQKQLQLDNIHTSLEKQTVKYEEVRGELQSLQRELQSVRQEAKAAVTSSDRLTQELQTKQAQVCSLEGQRDAARALNNKLTQEIKRLEAELENLQNSSRSADTTLFSTPCWNTTSPWEHTGSRKQERPGHRDEGQSRALHIRQQLQFSEVGTASLPQQHNNNTPHRHPSNQSDTFSTPLSAFPWERDDSRPAARRPSPSAPQTPCTDVISKGQQEQRVYGKEKDHRTETDTSLSEVRSRVAALEVELCAKAGMLKSIQNEMVQSKKELTARELSLQKARDELSLAHTGMAQERERASGCEQRLKQLQEELKCQRQNAESSRLQHQQRSKELEKQHQRDLTELQKERQCLEKQHQQEVNKLNQELQQARTLHNALQAQADKLSLQKQVLDKELDTLKEKLKWTEGQLQESQKKEAQRQAKLTEALREAEGVAVSLEQSRKREQGLEEEGRRLAEERADTLRLLKELQEQKAVPAPPQQSVQFCPVGQSFSPQTSYSLHSRPSTHIKGPSTTTLAEQKREEDVDKRRVEITASYPSDREPGEGIDSEDISNLIAPVSECLQRRHRRKSNEENKSRNEAIKSDSSGTNEHSTFDQVISSSSHSAAGTPTNTSMDDSSKKTPSLKASEDLKRENATLRSELNDAREELQKRLEDLEAQRQAETEARTRLKQLSRKRASQAVDKDEQEKEWRAQLESERAETERLRKAMASLETEMKREREEIERKEREEEEEEEEKNKALEDRESKLIELNIQLKKQLSEVKAQLALEQEERKREEEERNQLTNTDIDVKEELSTKLEELKAELEELKCSREEDSLEEEKLSVANSPLTYLTLHDDELNSNIVRCDNKLLPSPEKHLLFCQSTNQRNMLVSQATADLIQEERTVIDPECSALEDDRQNYLKGSSLSDHKRSLSDLQKVEPAFSDLAKEVERLKKENTKEIERANQYQVKLEALQSQVTCQTKQLTTAFEKQSQYISGLLVELQEKESALLSQGEELQRYKQELDALKAEKEGADKKRTDEMTVKVVEDGEQKKETQDERLVENSRLQANQENKCAVNLLTTNSLADGDSDAQRDAGQLEIVTSDAERPAPNGDESDSEALWSGEQHPCAQPKTQSNNDSACVMGETECSQDGETTDVVAELLALRQENQLLKQRIEGLTVSDTRRPLLHADSENQEDPAKQSQNTGNAALSCLVEHRSPSVPNDITTDARQSLLQDVKMREDGRTTKAEEELEAVSELQINRLQQQVEELQMRLRTLSAETQQQAGELVMWKLASQPAPTFDQFLPNTDKLSETLDQISAVRQSQSNQKTGQVQASYLGVQESPSNVTVVRQDELFLSCPSNKLQGCMLFSRLQHSNLLEPKSPHRSKKTAALLEYDQDSATLDKESEKENLEINLLHQLNTCQTQHKEERDTEVIQMSSEKMGQPHATKDSHKVTGPKQTKSAECYTGNPEAKPDASRATNEINPTNNSSDKYVRAEMKSVSSQTEESLYPRSAPTASELYCAYTQTEEEEKAEEELVESPPISHVSPVPLCEGAKLGDKMLFSGSFPIPADPAHLAERIRRNRTQLSAAFDDTEYEPYGLPEVVMKGFADIPSGPSCPYIVRRGLLGTTAVPVPPKDPRQEEETD
ncbi:centromere protein F isoform X1 [Perca fluviatilis]|nr:centromere protein F isoform X1 [Perca fluviatilis]XP_039669328.1 centromere protein F isoform X1 [Perca fluviatilis]XP_039669329.1 centromere protein F isoform X1 [Perca fluviatilis]XP_039669330.1 centromere protein F isoform X1 [Perca fluviatilis]